MKLAVLSGKGGTGKTLLSVNLASLSQDVLYLDCDVEAPNGKLFFKPEQVKTRQVQVMMPEVNEALCNGCRTCIDFCRFNALAYIGNKVKVFEDICHNCGGCAMVCPTHAISEREQAVGIIEEGRSEQVQVVTGVMNIGQASGVPIIDAMIARSRAHEGSVIIDCPPGSACVVMESIKEVDHCLVVAEPTIFGAHNMEMVLELTAKMGLPTSVVVNKSLGQDDLVEAVCDKAGVAIIGRIEFDSKLAKHLSEGQVAVRLDQTYKEVFGHILEVLNKEVAYEKTACS